MIPANVTQYIIETGLIPSNDTQFSTLVPVAVTQQTFEDIKSASESQIKYKQLNAVIHRIRKCTNRLQLRFPTVFRDGVVLQYLSQFITANDKIRSIACGLQSNYLPGFYALSQILAMSTEKFNFRINDLSLAPLSFFDALRTSTIDRFHLRFDDISDSNMKALCDALAANETLKDLVFGAKSLSNNSVEYLGELCGAMKAQRLSISIQSVSVDQMAVICEGLKRSRSISILDVEDCTMGYDGMKLLTAALTECAHIKSLTIGNNGIGSMQSFFEDLGSLQFIEMLICNESQLVRAELVDLKMISRSLIEMNKFQKLRRLQLPLFIFETSTNEALQLFVSALSDSNRIEVLQLFPLFEHLERGRSSQRGAAYNARISYFFHILFDGLSTSQSLQKLYVEMIGSESKFFTQSVAESFYRFLTESKITELYVPFCCLVDLKEEILTHGFSQCKHLVSVKDDTTDYHWLDRQKEDTSNSNNNWYYSRYKVGSAKREEMKKAKSYHLIAHKQCQANIMKEVIKHLPVADLAELISTFCGFEADPEYWMR